MAEMVSIGKASEYYNAYSNYGYHGNPLSNSKISNLVVLMAEMVILTNNALFVYGS